MINNIKYWKVAQQDKDWKKHLLDQEVTVNFSEQVFQWNDRQEARLKRGGEWKGGGKLEVVSVGNSFERVG